jgi:hypothetical protein
MNSQVAALISFLIYIAFFGWLGWRRGARREIIVTITALVASLLLQERGDILVSLTNLGGAAFNFASAGGLGGDQAAALAALSSAPRLITEESRLPFLFIAWSVIFVAAYIITNVTVQEKDSPQNGWAILFGMINGLFFAVAFLPSILTLFAAGTALPTDGVAVADTAISTIGGTGGLIGALRSGLGLLWEGIVSLWSGILSLGSMALLIIITLLLVAAATSIRGGAKARS